MTRNSAFTLVELVLVMAILGIIATIGVPISLGIYNRQQAVSNRDLLVSSLYQAQGLARAASNDTNWGIYVDSPQIVIYSGDSFVARDPLYDVLQTFSGEPTVTGATELNFGKLSGLPAAPATFTLSSGTNNLVISINSVGTIQI